LRTKKYLTKDVIELGFYSEKDLEIEPGQFCNLVFYDSNTKEKTTRSYSVVKYIDNILYFGIKLKPGGEGSKYIKQLQTGDMIK
jgi:ferredoxin-NADP reductase